MFSELASRQFKKVSVTLCTAAMQAVCYSTAWLWSPPEPFFMQVCWPMACSEQNHSVTLPFTFPHVRKAHEGKNRLDASLWCVDSELLQLRRNMMHSPNLLPVICSCTAEVSTCWLIEFFFRHIRLPRSSLFSVHPVESAWHGRHIWKFINPLSSAEKLKYICWSYPMARTTVSLFWWNHDWKGQHKRQCKSHKNS